MLPPCSEQALSQLLLRKEEEWRALQAQREQRQEAALRDAQRGLEEAQAQLRRLQEDFVYNLHVLEERDRELEHYEALLTQARAQEAARQAESSELRIEAAKLKQALAREARRGEELQQQQQRRAQEHRRELERLHSEKDSELDQQREQYESLKWRLERKLEELDGELALQRQELLREFESATQKREHAFRLRADDMSNVVLSHELKVKLLNKELEALKEAGAQAAERLERAETANAELESRLQGRAWELRDLEAVKDARIEELEEKLHAAQLARKRGEETLKRKCEELDHLVREKDLALVSVKEAHREQLRAQEARVVELQARCATLEGQLRTAERAQATAAEEKDAIIHRLREDAAALEAGRDARAAQMAKEAISRDLQVRMLQDGEEKLKAQLARFQQDIDRYKQQLTQAVERERGLERQQVQLGLDWQRRCEDIERDQIQKSEALIQGLTEARDQVAAKLQEAERALRDQEQALRAVTLERDQAVEALRGAGPLPGQEVQAPAQERDGDARGALPPAEAQQLREQNASLRNAVSQMRREMETLSLQIPPSSGLGENPGADPPDPGAGGDTARPGYVLALEAEIQSLQRKFQSLEEQLVSAPEPAARGAETGGGAPGPALARTGLALRKLRDRVLLLDMLVTELRKKVRRRPLEPGLRHGVEQVQLEVQELQTQVAELERHLGAAGQEGGASPEQGPAEGLDDGRGVGTADRGRWPACPQPAAQPAQPSPTPHLRQKLRDAARNILRLRLEKEQLIEMGNRLRAELGQTKGKPLPRPPLVALEPLVAPEAPGRPGPPSGALPPRDTQDPQRTKRRSSAHPAGKSQPHSAQTAPSQKENQSPKPPRAPDAPGEDGPHTRASSSPASSSLRDTWRLLDLGSSPSGLPSQEDPTPGRTPGLC
ncbi:coiled-coil domain-containing protein 57 [Perognathus longimembris pacificus]|uniref:coiled-coil domain-containing protein 57 n=1 Tax=Perognathus longimembris pacificus TaxID=214514 RepID=UPI002019D9A5|nr:coiled-coil domain-containing protein 57 [Perognathus longimembris pacificus]